MYDNILDEISQEDLAERNLLRLKKQKKMLSYVYAGICLVGGIISGLAKIRALDVYEISFVVGSVIGAFLVTSILAFLTGGIFSLIPYGGFTYRQRFVKTFLICAIVFAVIFLLASLSNLLKAIH